MNGLPMEDCRTIALIPKHLSIGRSSDSLPSSRPSPLPFVESDHQTG